MKQLYSIAVLFLLAILCSCGRETGKKPASSEQQEPAPMFTPVEGKVRIMNLDPGHFHAALVQKRMYADVDPVVYVYAPEGPEVESYLSSIRDYNSREADPTSWEEKVYTGSDFLEKMLEEKSGNVMVVSGNNAKKTEYILKAVQAGIHVLADKPMVITPEAFPVLEEAFEAARENGVLLYDIMTERYEVTTILQKELSRIPEVFGEVVPGTPDNPAITKESVHHFFKYVSGKPLVRPPWFFDVRQQGEGIVDVTTHLVDLVQWEAFPGVVLDKGDVEILSARRWTTDLTPDMFEKVTGLPPEGCGRWPAEGIQQRGDQLQAERGARQGVRHLELPGPRGRGGHPLFGHEGHKLQPGDPAGPGGGVQTGALYRAEPAG
jgi:hypothetical protein